MGNPKGVKRDLEALEKRRFEAVRLVVEQGWSQTAAARQVKAAQQSVSRWVGEYRRRGAAGLRRAGRAGRKPRLDAALRERLAPLLLEGPEAHGFPTPLWTCPRVALLAAMLICTFSGVRNFRLTLTPARPASTWATTALPASVCEEG